MKGKKINFKDNTLDNIKKCLFLCDKIYRFDELPIGQIFYYDKNKWEKVDEENAKVLYTENILYKVGQVYKQWSFQYCYLEENEK